MFRRRKPQPTLAELSARKKEIEMQIIRYSEAQLEDLKHQLFIIAETQGVTIADLFGVRPPPLPKEEKKERKKRDVKIKYRNPETGDTWSGLGRPKKWLQTKLDEGHAIEEYAVA
jgi:DNA-binding protein H-NS